jgi:hypothetical protein
MTNFKASNNEAHDAADGRDQGEIKDR